MENKPPKDPTASTTSFDATLLRPLPRRPHLQHGRRGARVPRRAARARAALRAREVSRAERSDLPGGSHPRPSLWGSEKVGVKKVKQGPHSEVLKRKSHSLPEIFFIFNNSVGFSGLWEGLWVQSECSIPPFPFSSWTCVWGFPTQLLVRQLEAFQV